MAKEKMKMLDEKQLKIACLKKDVKYADLAGVLGVSLSTLYYKIKRDTFRRDEAAKLADFLGVDMVKVFFFGDDETSSKKSRTKTTNGKSAEAREADAASR